MKTKPPTGQASYFLLAEPSLAGEMAPSVYLERHAINAVTRPPTGQARFSLLVDPNRAGELARSVEVEQPAIHAAMMPIVPGGKWEFAPASSFKMH